MKKALSILLVAAALFGFYGSAVTVNDILACKDYWEEAGEKSTADMNKLEDGLKQLQENEAAYLEGQDQLAEGEKTLADAEAAYAAAPGQLAAGAKQLSEGEKSYKDLQKLIKGLQKARKHGVSATSKHDEYWHDAFTNALAPGRALIVKTLTDQKDMVNMLGGLVGVSGLVESAANAGSYPAFDNALVKKLIPAFTGASTALNNFATLAGSKGKDLSDASTLLTNIDGFESNWEALTGATGYDKPMVAANELEFVETYGSATGTSGLKPYLSSIVSSAGAYKSAFPASRFVKKGVADQLTQFLNEYGDKLEGLKSNPDVAQLVGAMKQLAGYDLASDSINNATFNNYVQAVASGLTNKAVPMLQQYAKTAKDSADQFQQWDDGYQTLSHAKDGETSKKYPDDLASKKSGVPFAFKNMVTNKTIKAAVKKYDPSLMKILKKYSGNRLKNDSMEEFDSDITYLGKKVIPRALKVLAKVKSSAAKQLSDGRKQLAEGKASYAAAPGQLEAGRQQLADGKAQLAQYEDGEQQIRDGLATLFNTEADLDLESIADRLNGDGDFDNGDEHLDIDEGLNAVEVGRGYQAEDGVLITNEIMGRAVATGGLLGAGVLAVLAAILSFLKKNKGAAISALLAAAAGAFGAFYGPAQGTYFSDIAGSTVGTTTWVAAGVLGAVALVHAIVHFTAKKEA